MWFGMVSALWLMSACSLSEEEQAFVASKFRDDTERYRLDQIVTLPSGQRFVAVFYDPNSSMSGNRRVLLYSEDSVAQDALFYGAHPMEIANCTDTSITMKVGVYSAHGEDEEHRRWYLDGSVDKNVEIGQYHLFYIKDYNLHPG